MDIIVESTGSSQTDANATLSFEVDDGEEEENELPEDEMEEMEEEPYFPHELTSPEPIYEYGLDIMSPRSVSEPSADCSRTSSELTFSESEAPEDLADDGAPLTWQDKVKVVRSRAHVDGLQAAVKEKEHIVAHSSEELKKCKEKIKTLQSAAEATLAELQQTCDMANVPAVDRLRATHSRICQELQCEKKLMKQLEQDLSQAQYRLSRVELNKKSVVCVERELQKDESKWAAQRAVDAQIRQLKEKRYLNNCAASKRLQQRRMLEQTNERNALEAMLHEQSQESKKRHTKFVRQSEARAKERREKEKLIQEDHKERRIKTVMSLKRDLEVNEENMRTLKARDAFRAKTANAAEKKKSACDHRDLAAVKEMRQKMFEQQRQAKLEEQKQREVEIVEKIISEEKALATRKKLQPHLYVDCHKPIERRRIPKQSKTLAALQKSEPQPEPPAYDLSRFEGLTGDESDDDEDDAEEAENMSENARICDDDTEQLVEPEFAGLWDKQPPFKPVRTDDVETSRPKSCNASKMEQEIMQRRLTQLRRSHVVKQVIAGREFKGQPFRAKPEIVLFKDFGVGDTYEQKVVLMNSTHAMTSCKLIGMSDELKDFISLSFSPPGQLSVGMTCKLHVTFKPMIDEDIEGTIDFLAQTGPFSLPVRCLKKRCDLKVDINLIDFGTAVIDETLTRSIVLTNSGARQAMFTFDAAPYGLKSEPVTAAEPADGSSDTARGSASATAPADAATELPDIPSAASGPEVELTGWKKSLQADDKLELVSSSFPFPSGMLDDMTIQNKTGVIGPFSTVKLTVQWQPTIPGQVRSKFVLSFDDEDSNDIFIRAVALAIDVPLWVERPTVDLKICMYDRLYQDSVVIHNRATYALKFQFIVKKELRNHLEILPRTGFIQAQSTFTAQIKFLPRQTLPDDAPDYFDPEVCVLAAAVIINILNQKRPAYFSISAIVTTSDLEFDVSDIDFGHCTIYEAVTKSIRLTNYSMLPQEFGFVGLPEYVQVQPGDGFGTILAKETITLDVIFQPDRANDYNFELSCKTLINREFKLKCHGVGVHPPLQLSHQLIHFKATGLFDTSIASILVINSHLDKQEYKHPVARIGTGEIAAVGPTSFEFCVPDGVPLTVSPAVGTVLPGQKCKVSIRFSPTLSDEDIRREAVKLVVADLEWKAAEEQQRVAEQEREGAVVEVQKVKKGSKSKLVSPKSMRSVDTPTTTESQVTTIERPTEDSIAKNSKEYDAARASLIRQFTSQFHLYNIPCYVATAAISSSPVPYSVHNTLYVEVRCPVVRPDVVVISNNGQTVTDFGQVSVGQRVVKSVTVQNMSHYAIALHASCLATEGPFSLLNALRTLNAGATHSLHVCFEPHLVHQFQETLVLDCSTCSKCTLHLTFRGSGVSPDIDVSVQDGVLDFGYVQAGDFREQIFTITNRSAVSVEYRVRLGSEPIHLTARTQLSTSLRHADHMITQPVVGTQNYSGQQVFDCIPAQGLIESGSTKEITATFSPDHSSCWFSDVCYIDLFGQKESFSFQLKGCATDHIMYVRGGEPLSADVQSLSAIPQPESDENIPPVAVLVALHCPASATEFVSATREIFIGCVKSTPGFVRKGGGGGKQNVEWTFDTQQLASLGFAIDPLKGVVEAGSERPISISWTPPAGHESKAVASANINCSVRGDVTVVYNFMLRGFISGES